MAISLRQLERFVKTRNKSPHNSNLQFQIDANACGFKVGDLGKVTKSENGVYYWETPAGMLVECFGQMSLAEKPYDVAYVLGQARTRAMA